MRATVSLYCSSPRRCNQAGVCQDPAHCSQIAADWITRADDLSFIRKPLLDTTVQRLIPFLGAGASLSQVDSGLSVIASSTTVASESNARSQCAQDVLQIAERLAHAIDDLDTRGLLKLPDDKPSTSAPSSGELAEELAAVANFRYFERPAENLRKALGLDIPRQRIASALYWITKLSAVASPFPPLLPVASLLSVSSPKRELLKAKLAAVISPVKDTTTTIEMVAKVAADFWRARQHQRLANTAQDDYLIVTTNYDQLIENALERLEVPTCTFTVYGKKDKHRTTQVRAILSKRASELLKADTEHAGAIEEYLTGYDPGAGVTLEKFNEGRPGPPLVFVYKIHGCVKLLKEQDLDNIVISDHDYVDYIENNGAGSGLVPRFASLRMGESRFLALGYSFSDWNIQVLFKRLTRGRPKDDPGDERRRRDIVVSRSFDPNYDVFLSEQDAHVLLTTLDRFAQAMKVVEPMSAAV
jgi:hypothetical protein